MRSAFLALEERLEVRGSRERRIELDHDRLARREVAGLDRSRARRNVAEHALQELAAAAELRCAAREVEVGAQELLLLRERAPLLVDAAGEPTAQVVRLGPGLDGGVVRLDRFEEVHARLIREAVVARGRRRALRRLPRRAARKVAPRLLERAHGEDEPACCVEQVHVAARAHELEQQLVALGGPVEREREDAVAVADPSRRKARAGEVRTEVLREGRRSGRRGLGRGAPPDARGARPAREEEGGPPGAREAELELDRLALHDALEARPAEVPLHRLRGPLELPEAQHGGQGSPDSPRGPRLAYLVNVH